MRLAVVQAPAQLDGSAARLNWLEGCLGEIAQQGADLVVLPELFACGYNIGDALISEAEAADGPVFAAMSEMASRFGVAIHYGFAERDGDKLFNAAICVSPDGEVLCHHRKLTIPPGFECDYFTPGQGCQVFTYRGLRIATLICYDVEFPETVRHVAAEGAELVLVPTALGADWSWVAHSMIPTRAYENGVFLAYVNSAGVENGMEFLGASVVAAPDGVEVVRAGRAPDIVYADLDKARVTAAQTLLPYLVDRKAIRF
ncbi:carbon-nitrogen hydrolase family protein [Falsiphaeobacter marinintestinus]|uniref:carbon-nitrogen hydrolase family protein n=1 Tax=Falsiphaeobacter marinintestinus TaxID=1492905 RepID=UPI0011B710D9|nr:carbon-nitrogen hydrolase family protein [Phaeobacter marinintestinus]